ncbi:ubiquitin carboxyl-terminal hydrolase 8 [Lingula anatina]|uniref:ubiquitinyl hydrolase 1 n=1 Tax=Lingula anatina TaxID=7574 RepID=A0A1S3ILW4_LINAN|nr:ubiquitin carboxyl-terminal hydrolase 8 [Lingula anatina]|eukprot:XP_013398509.1 ubiquitin carboxyl-terminal hydrolase 8 [Lingula anatina]
MPSYSSKKPLHVAKNMAELNKLAEVKQKFTSARIAVKSAEKIFNHAEQAKLDGDEERGYVMYMRYFNIITIAKKLPDYKKNEEFFSKMIGGKNQLKAIEEAEALSSSLKDRYELLEAEHVKARLDERDKKKEQELERKQKEEKEMVKQLEEQEMAKEKINENNEAPEKENQFASGAVSCRKLYEMLQTPDCSVLILDIRAAADYENSHVRDPSCINVPADILPGGCTVAMIEKNLPTEALPMWKKRGHVGYIVLLDWQSSLADLVTNSPLNNLKDAIYKWDQLVIVQHEPLVLDGGYEDWLLYYPTLTTNSNVSAPQSDTKKDQSALPSLDFDYPDLDEEPPEPQKSDVQNGPSLQQINTDGTVTTSTGQNRPVVDRSMKPKPPVSAVAGSDSNKSFQPPFTKPATDSIYQELKKQLTEKSSSSSITNFVPQNSRAAENDLIKTVLDDETKVQPQSRPQIPQVNRSLKPKPRPIQEYSESSDSSTLATAQKDITARLDELRVETEEKEREMLEYKKEREKLVAEHKARLARLKDEEDRIERLQAMREKEEKEVAELLRKKKMIERQIKTEEEKQEEEQQRIKEEEKRKEEDLHQIKQEEKEKLKMQQEVERLRQERKKKEMEDKRREQEIQEHKENMKAEQDKLNRERADKAAREEQERRDKEAALRLQEQKEAEDARRLADEQRKTAAQESARKAMEEKARLEAEEKSRNKAEEKYKYDAEEKAKLEASEKIRRETEERERVENAAEEKARKDAEEKARADQAKRATPQDTSLPRGWEAKVDVRTGRTFYIDHNTGTTHWSFQTQPQVSPSASGRYFMQLQDEPSKPKTNLKRTNSSPNLTKLGDDDDFKGTKLFPSIDRTTKPAARFSTPQLRDENVKPVLTEITAARLRGFQPVYGSVGRGLTGLRNLGNTCYMNSTIQCLSNTPLLAKYFLDSIYRNHINRENKLGRKGVVADEFALLITVLWSGQYKFVAPRDFKGVMGRFNSTFSGFDQQDSQEFLMFLLDALHEDLNEVTVRPKMLELDSDQVRDHRILAEEAWKAHKMANKSYIVELFQGQYKSTLTCLTCRKQSVTFDTFMYLTLPLPSSNRCTLQDCLRLYQKEEKIQWKCSQCKKDRDAVKKLDLWKLPHLLIIHFNRFHFGYRGQKLTIYVDFPLTALDMNNHISGPKGRPEYNLYAVSNHYGGTLESGHYTAFCKNALNQRWYKFDDDDVYEISKSNVKSSAAYFLFYTSKEMKSVL